MSKILFFKKLINHIHEHKVIPDTQLEFQQQHSTVHQLARVISSLKTAQHIKQSTSLVTLGIDKVFDLIWHNGLLLK